MFLQRWHWVRQLPGVLGLDSCGRENLTSVRSTPGVVSHLTLEMQRMPPALPSGSPTRRRWGDLGSPAGPGAAAGLGCSQCVSAAPSAVPPPPGWAGPAPGGPAPAWPAAGIGWRARRPLHTSLAGGGEGSQAGSWPPPPLQCLPPCAPAGIMGGPPAHAPEEAGRGRAGRAGRDRPAQTQEERQYLVCVCGSEEGGKTRNENKNTGRRTSPSTAARLGGSWRQEDGPCCPLFPRPHPSHPSACPQRCQGCSRRSLLLSCCHPGSSVSLASFAGGNKGW